MRLWAIIAILAFHVGYVKTELAAIKHMVNEVICVALELEG